MERKLKLKLSVMKGASGTAPGFHPRCPYGPHRAGILPDEGGAARFRLSLQIQHSPPGAGGADAGETVVHAGSTPVRASRGAVA
ncbi:MULTISPECIES: hypothetical protein [Thermomonospora]|uniref:Uncharacterized protein n=1 Tax=Thermomonospora curvata (strain ATCC 19995 / DSM 43183 / JCM 3096 / KCTC 9072 / NBRC 15933 / NCIMB 10081 / Henssen B9) TaxID=471852 RepID=D1A1M7_THECD|nr:MULTISPECIES: hypothetical protein [Thermomonospora]ACY97715.1 hypothetical protein Tcur_2149 [Thermomonospora curvata DSM 43183]